MNPTRHPTFPPDFCFRSAEGQETTMKSIVSFLSILCLAIFPAHAAEAVK